VTAALDRLEPVERFVEIVGQLELRGAERSGRLRRLLCCLLVARPLP
jgi:hypothetical protein